MKSGMLHAAFFLLAVVLSGLSTRAQATEKDSGNFPFKYEMDQNPGTLDLDLDGNTDWVTQSTGTVSDGTMDMAPGSDIHGYTLNQIWSLQSSFSAGWTWEMRLKVLSQTGSRGATSIQLTAAGSPSPPSIVLFVGAGDQKWGVGSLNPVDLGSNNNADDFHTFRITELPAANSFFVYRDGFLLNPGGTPLTKNLNGTPDIGEVTFGPNNSGASNGETLVDYIRFDNTGAYSPVALTGDFNRDGHVNAADIKIMLQALTDSAAYESAYGVDASMFLKIADINNDGAVTNSDTQSFLGFLKNGNGSASAVPEPASLTLSVLGGVIFLCVSNKVQNKRQRNSGLMS